MKFEIENNIIASYKRLSYDAWYAFAEFVDNSTQAYFDNKQILDDQFEKTGSKLKISIDYKRDLDQILIIDNSMGMDEADLSRAFKVGQPPPITSGRSKYGLGMKTAACWFGNKWSIKTKKMGDTKTYEVNIDVAEIAGSIGDVNLNPKITEDIPDAHYTIIKITDLNRAFVGRTLWKIKDFLSSIYRFDIADGIEIKWNDAILTWQGYEKELHILEDGTRFKKRFQFEINGKPVDGWVGVLGRGFGSRKKTGFSIIQNRRVIQNVYKPTSLYGDQEDGGNDLVNQRLVGELFLDKFSVSHTKDKIVWEGPEEEILDEKLGQFCSQARELALTLRFKADQDNGTILKFKEDAIAVLTSELRSTEIRDYIKSVQPYPEKIITSSYNKTSDRIKSETDANITATIGEKGDQIHVAVYFSEKSEFEPYVLTETTIDDDRVVVMVNILHPHVQEMKSPDSFTNFIRHCIYDGVSEWKALKLRGDIQPYTIKFLKDGLLRIPFEIKSHKAM